MRETYGALIGQKIGDLKNGPKWLNRSLSQHNLSIGDLVIYDRLSYDLGVIYRIEEDSPPRRDATLRQVNTVIPEVKLIRWCFPDTGKEMPMKTLKGHVTLKQVFELFPSRFSRNDRKKVNYNFLFALRKIDVIQLGKSFASFKEFVEEEVRRIADE